MELKDLVGEHYLSGVDIEHSYNSYNEYFETIRFVLDDKTYKAIEDPDDGYRSYMRKLTVTDEVISNIFQPQKVIAKMNGNGRYSSSDIIQFTDAVTGKIVLEVGTDYSDDYYPCCVMRWNPENLAINIDSNN